MNIKKIYIGSWFQRTPLHLSEIYDFLRGEGSPLELDRSKLQKNLDNLNILSVRMVPSELDYLEVETRDGIGLKITEDGLIRMDKDHEDLAGDIDKLRKYYEESFSPALSYIFSLGAPIPKELANIKNIYPYFVIIQKGKRQDIYELIKHFRQNRHFEVRQKTFEIYRGDKLYIINNLSEHLPSIERFIEEHIFMREYRGQLHRYLNLHRIIWEKIADIKEQGEIQGKDIVSYKNTIEEYNKTINLIEARINQMDTFIETRAKVVARDAALRRFIGVLQFKHETLLDTQAYIQDIWTMTKQYVGSSLDLFSELQAKSTERTVKNLAVVTSMGVGATLIGLFTMKIPSFTIDGVVYFLIVVGVGYAADKIITYVYHRRRYKIRDVEIKKDI